MPKAVLISDWFAFGIELQKDNETGGIDLVDNTEIKAKTDNLTQASEKEVTEMEDTEKFFHCTSYLRLAEVNQMNKEQYLFRVEGKMKQKGETAFFSPKKRNLSSMRNGQ